MEQGVDHPFSALGATHIEHGVFLLLGGGFDFPIQDAPPKGAEQLLFFAGGGQQHDHPNIGARKVLNQTGQQLNFVVGQGRGVMHDPNFWVGYPGGGVSGGIYRGADQHVVKTR